MLSSNHAQLKRVQALLALAKEEYDTLQYISHEGMIEVQVRSRRRAVSIPVSQEVAVHVYGYLTEEAWSRIQQLEKDELFYQREAVIEAEELEQEAVENNELRDQARQLVALDQQEPTEADQSHE